MKNRFMKMVAAGVLAAVMTVTAVNAGPSIMAGITVTQDAQKITADAGITDKNGNPVTAGTIEVTAIMQADPTKEQEIITPVSEEVKEQIFKINDAIKEAAETGDVKAYKEAMKEMVEKEQIELVNKEDKFNVAASEPLTTINDVVVKDENGNVIEGAKNVDVQIEVPNLTKAIKDIRVLYYDIEKEKWIVVEPEIDYEKKTLKFHMDIVGPIMVVYDPETVAAE